MIYGKGDTREVWIQGKLLDYTRSWQLKRHSPDGGAWGYAGSGPAQLALALLLEFTSETEALARYQDFKCDLLVPLPMGHDFTWPESLVEAWLADRTAPCEDPPRDWDRDRDHTAGLENTGEIER